MKVHHLNCGTLYPFGCGEMVCHVLLVETGNGLVLIDTGFRPKDCGDAFFHHGAVDGTVPMPRELAAFECPFPGYSAEVRLTPAGAGTHISYTVSPQRASRWSRRPWQCSVGCCFAFSRASPRRRAETPPLTRYRPVP